ncbi:MAG: hypothetical protein ACLQPD_31175 [Desulfomonilaceae bacterium]
MESGFDPFSPVTKPEFLFGHNLPGGLLDGLTSQVRLGANTQILGERRSGKTSLIWCCISRLHAEFPRIIPVYINYRQYATIKGYAPAYRLMLSLIHAAVTERNCNGFPKEVTIGSITLPFTRSPEDCYHHLCDVDEIMLGAIMGQYITMLSNCGYGIVLFLDEYEHLIRYTFSDEPGLFFELRELASKPRPKSGIPRPLTYVVAGALPWHELSHIVGSPELNTIGPVLTVGPIDVPAFYQMWESCLASSVRESTGTCDAVMPRVGEVYEMVGGWPFYGKFVGQSLFAEGTVADNLYSSLSQHFAVSWSRSPSQRERLAEAFRDHPQTKDSEIEDLIQRGLIQQVSDSLFKIRGGLWKRYVGEHIAHSLEDSSKSEIVETDRLRYLVDDVAELVSDINESSLNVCGREVYVSSNQDHRNYRDLRTPATDETTFSQFALALYNLVYERTTAPVGIGAGEENGKTGSENRCRSLESLPKKFRQKRTVVRVIGSVRHHFGKAHMTRLPHFDASGKQMPIGDILDKYLGSRAKPDKRQYLVMQERLLWDLIQYLRELDGHFRVPSGGAN